MEDGSFRLSHYHLSFIIYHLSFERGGVGSVNIGETKVIQASRYGTGRVSAVSESPNIVRIDSVVQTAGGADITVTGLAAGTARISASVAQTAIYRGQTVTMPVSVAVSGTSPVPYQGGTLVWNGGAQSPVWVGYDASLLTIGGTTSASDAGTYTAVFTPKAGVTWEDGTTGAKSVSWAIGKLSLAKPAQSGTLIFNGNAQSPTWSGYNGAYMAASGDTSATNAGTYTAIFSLLDSVNCQWSDGTSGPSGVNWTIGKASPNLNVPSQSDIDQYPIDMGGSGYINITVTFSGDGAFSARSGSTGVATVESTRLGAGYYRVTATGVSTGGAVITFSVAESANYEAQSTTRTVTVANQTIEMPTQSGALTYSGSSQSPTWSGYDSAKMTLGGTTSGTDAGSYTATFTPKTGYQWSDTGTTTARDVTWTIGKASPNLTVPDNWGDITEGAYLLVTVLWDGDGNIGARASTGTVTVAYYDRPSGYSRNVARFKVTGVSAGSTDVIFSVSGTTNYSAQNAMRTATVVAKQSPDLRLNTPLPWNMRSGDWRWSRITRNGNGALSARSSNTNVAEASITVTDGSEGLRVDAIGPGSATITVEAAETSAYYGEATAGRVSVTNTKTLNDYTWDEISAISQAGTGDTYFDVGDVKMITLNGTVGTKTYSNVSLGVYILDFNHVDGGAADNNIIWGGFKTALTGGVDVALDDTYYNTGMADGTKAFNMSHWGNYNYGGWKGCDLRYDILGATKTAPSGYGSAPVSGRVGFDATQTAITSPVANTLMAALPSDFRNVLRLRTHYVDNVGGGTGTSSDVTAVVDAVSLLAEFEVLGVRTYANQYEQDHQTQMAYYAEGNSAAKYRQSSAGTSANWMLCSPGYDRATAFAMVFTTGDRSTLANAQGVFALSPVFKT